MAYRDLRDFIAKLEKEGELRRISAEVDPVLEITEITDRVTRAGGPALLFEKPEGSRVPLLINMLGSERRMNLALEVSDVDEVAARIRGFLDMQSPQGLLDKIKMLPKLAELGSFFPKTVKSGPCKEVIRRDDFSLFEFPILQCWPQDAGRFITWPLVFTRNPETGKRNVGVYRMQVYDERTTGMHWQTQKHGAEHFRRARAANPDGRIDVAVAIGSDPMTCLSGILPIPPDLDEMMFAGFLRREPVEMVRLRNLRTGSSRQCRNRSRRICGFERDAHRGPVRRSHRLLFAGRGVSRFSRYLRHASPRSYLSDHHRRSAAAGRLLHGPRGGADFSAGDEDAISGNRGRGHARRRRLSQPDDRRRSANPIPATPAKSCTRIWSLGQAMFTKVVVVVDHDVNVQDLPRSGLESALRDRSGTGCGIRAWARRIRWTMPRGIQDYGSKMGMDATRKWESEGFRRPWPDEIVMDAATKKRIDSIWHTLGSETVAQSPPKSVWKAHTSNSGPSIH